MAMADAAAGEYMARWSRPAAHVPLAADEHGGRLTPAGCRAAAVWLWAALTCGERRDAPALADPGWSAVPLKSRLRTVRSMSRWMPDAVAVRLLRFGQTLTDGPEPC